MTMISWDVVLQEQEQNLEISASELDLPALLPDPMEKGSRSRSNSNGSAEDCSTDSSSILKNTIILF